MTEGFVDRLGDTLVPVLDQWAQPEYAFLRNDIRFSRFSVQAAVAARFSSIQLVLPDTAQVLVIIDKIVPAFATDIDVQLDPLGAVIGNLNNATRGLSNDDRYQSGLLSSQVTVNEVDNAAGASLTQWRISTATPGRDVPWFVLAPDSKLFLFSTAVNTTIAANISWREYPIFPTERASV